MSKESTFESVVSKLSTNQKRFIAELVGTFIVVVLATGSVVINAKLNGILGLTIHCICSFCGCCNRCISFWKNLYGSF